MNKLFKKSDILILSAAILSMVISIVIWFSGNHDAGLFIGIWVPSILGFGNYVKTLITQRNTERT